MPLLDIDGLVVEHRINRRLKHAYLNVEHDGTVVLKSNGSDCKSLERFVRAKRAWIEKQQTQAAVHPTMEPGKTILLFGDCVDIRSAGISIDGASGALPVQRRYDRFYREHAQRYLEPKTHEFALKMGVGIKKIRLRKMKRRWGSCSHEGVITFNTLLMQLPENMIDYTIAHELAHRIHFNHSADFHKKVSEFIPDEKALRTAMRHRRAVLY